MEQNFVDWTTILTGIFSAVIGGFIGTYGGAFFIHKHINKKIKKLEK